MAGYCSASQYLRHLQSGGLNVVHILDPKRPSLLFIKGFLGYSLLQYRHIEHAQNYSSPSGVLLLHKIWV